MAPSSRNGALRATRGVTIALVSARERKRRQPGLATDGPELVGWLQLVGSIQGSQVHFYFVGAAGENGRAAAGAEMPPGIVACFALDRHRIQREYRGGVEQGSVVLAAVEAVTKSDPVWESRRRDSDVAAQATAGEAVHAASPLRSSDQNGYNARHCHRNESLRWAAASAKGEPATQHNLCKRKRRSDWAAADKIGCCGESWLRGEDLNL